MAKRHQVVRFRQPRRKVIVSADADKLRMVIDNLVSNASKYTPEQGRIEVTLESSSRLVRIAIRDTGVGINKKDIKRLFTNSRDWRMNFLPPWEGQASAVYLAKKIVDLHSGKIQVDSVLERGSTFTIELPIRRK